MKQQPQMKAPASYAARFTRAVLTTAVVAAFAASSPAIAAKAKVEKPDLKFGFIKLTDMVPLAVAYEKGYFEDEGLFVTLEAQANWKVLLDRVISGELDGAHMLAGQPIGATIGYGTKADIITAFSMDLNGNAITVSNAVMEKLKANPGHGHFQMLLRVYLDRDSAVKTEYVTHHVD